MSRVLILEDDPVLRTSMARSLARMPGVEVVEAGTLAEAVGALDATPPQLVLSDLDLPDGSGIEILAELGRRARRVPVVFISAYLRNYSARIPRHADIDVREKPVSLEELHTLVTRHLQARPEPAATPFTARDYLQLACFGRHSVVIDVRRQGAAPGRIVVSQGDLWSARDDAGTGEAALLRLLRLNPAGAECRTLASDAGVRDVHRGWQALLLESTRAEAPETPDARAADPAAGEHGDATVLLVEPDAGLREQLAAALQEAAIEVVACADAAAAQACLATRRPSLVLCRAGSESPDAAALLAVLSRTPELSALPRVVLAASGAPAGLLDSLEHGADDVVTLGMGARAIVAKLRTVLRLVRRVTPSPAAGGRSVSGVLGAGGALTLVKLCEERRLNARLTVTCGAETYWVDFVGGEIAGSGAEREQSGEDALDALLAAVQGTYRIDLRDPDLGGLAGAASPAGAPGNAERPLATVAAACGMATLPAGRLSELAVDGASYQIQTEGTDRGVFCVTTIIARDGRVVRKLESAWARPLATADDQLAARADIDRQHERALAELPGATPAAATPGPDEEPAFDALAELALSALLRKDYAAAAQAFGAAAQLRPDDARVRANIERLRQLGHAVDGGRHGEGG